MENKKQETKRGKEKRKKGRKRKLKEYEQKSNYVCIVLGEQT